MLNNLEREIKQSRPFASACQEASLSLLRSADALRRLYAVVMEPFGITFQQYNVLRILRGAGEAGLPTTEIAERMIERSPGLTRLIDRLEAKGWVERARTKEDRRQVICTITGKGQQLIGDVEGPVRAAEQAAMARFDETGIDKFIENLRDIRQQVSDVLTGQ